MFGGKAGLVGERRDGVVRSRARRRCLAVAARAGRGWFTRWVVMRFVSQVVEGLGRSLDVRRLETSLACWAAMAVVLLGR